MKKTWKKWKKMKKKEKKNWGKLQLFIFWKIAIFLEFVFSFFDHFFLSLLLPVVELMKNDKKWWKMIKKMKKWKKKTRKIAIFQKMKNCNFPRVFFIFSIFFIFSHFFHFFSFVPFFSFFYHFSSFLLPVVQKFSQKWKIAIFLGFFFIFSFFFHFFMFLSFFIIFYHFSSIPPLEAKMIKKNDKKMNKTRGKLHFLFFGKFLHHWKQKWWKHDKKKWKNDKKMIKKMIITWNEKKWRW